MGRLRSGTRRLPYRPGRSDTTRRGPRSRGTSQTSRRRTRRRRRRRPGPRRGNRPRRTRSGSATSRRPRSRGAHRRSLARSRSTGCRSLPRCGGTNRRSLPHRARTGSRRLPAGSRRTRRGSRSGPLGRRALLGSRRSGLLGDGRDGPPRLGRRPRQPGGHPPCRRRRSGRGAGGRTRPGPARPAAGFLTPLQLADLRPKPIDLTLPREVENPEHLVGTRPNHPPDPLGRPPPLGRPRRVRVEHVHDGLASVARGRLGERRGHLYDATQRVEHHANPLVT